MYYDLSMTSNIIFQQKMTSNIVWNHFFML